MQLGPFQFTPQWVATLVTLPLLGVLISLGFWQLERSAQKATIIAAHARLMTQAPTSVAAVGRATLQRHQKIRAQGQLDGAHQFLIDNRIHQRTAGYHVVTPLLLSDNSVLLINRGWVATGYDRNQLPQLDVTDIAVTLSGATHFPATEQLLLGESGYANETWPRVVQRLEPQTIAKILGKSVKAYTMRLEAELNDKLVRVWPVHYGITPDRHNGYAFQWFALAIALLTIYIVVNTRRNKTRE